MNIVVLAAGNGRRFAEAGYDKPKPLIDVDGRKMIERVIDNIRPSMSHNLYLMVRPDFPPVQAPPNQFVKAVVVPELTEGAACTALLAREYIDNNDPLMLSNSDELLDWDVDGFLRFAAFYDGAVVLFPGRDPQWSYARLEELRIVEIAEKRRISPLATAGIYYWAHGNDFVKAAEKMIAANDRTNGEFYVAPVYNHFIDDTKFVAPYIIGADNHHSLGTPEHLEEYLKWRTSQSTGAGATDAGRRIPTA